VLKLVDRFVPAHSIITCTPRAHARSISPDCLKPGEIRRSKARARAGPRSPRRTRHGAVLTPLTPHPARKQASAPRDDPGDGYAAFARPVPALPAGCRSVR
jgi:hypothetical protein